MSESFISTLWNNPKNRRTIKDGLLFAISTIAFHFLYWHTDMNTWLFGSFTNTVFDFFTNIAYSGGRFLMDNFCDLSYDCYDRNFAFYTESSAGVKTYFANMEIVHDCSAIKQLMQFLLIMLLCPNKLWKRLIYFCIGSIILIIANIIRIYLLTNAFGQDPASFRFYHDWVARPMMYVVIFALWVVWIEFFAYRDSSNKTPKEQHLTCDAVQE